MLILKVFLIIFLIVAAAVWGLLIRGIFVWLNSVAAENDITSQDVEKARSIMEIHIPSGF